MGVRSFSYQLRRFLRIVPYLVSIWTVVTLGASRVSGLRTEAFGLADLAIGLLAGVVIGSAMTYFETRPVRRGFINKYSYLDVVMRAVLYTAAIALFLFLGRQLMAIFFPTEVYRNRSGR